MESVDKGDVNIEKLFGWKGSFKILDEKNEVLFTIYMRLVGDADMNRARVYALRESSKLRRTLHNKDSDEFLAMISPAEFMTKDALIDSIASLRVRDLAQEAVREIRLDIPKEPKDDATLEEQELYQKEIDAFPEKRSNALQEYVNNRLEEIKEPLLKEDAESLYKNYYIPTAMNLLCESRMIEAYRDYCVIAATYKDENYKTKFFSSMEEFDNLQTVYKTQFRDSYLTLELGIEDLKK